MPAAANRATAIRFVTTMREHGGFDEKLVTDDFQWWASNTGYVDKKTLRGHLDKLVEAMPLFPEMTVVGVAAEGDRVAIETEGKLVLPDGRPYNNHYHFLLQFKDGRIRLAKEYNDTQLVADAFGFRTPTGVTL
jgi:ketosteroid isomerase-like protein